MTVFLPIQAQSSPYMVFWSVMISLIGFGKTYFLDKMVSMATKIIWLFNDIISDQNAKYGEHWA